MTESIYDALRESHEIQRSLCRKLLRSQPGTKHRKDLFTQLRIELAAHEAAEERFLYVPLLMHDMGLNSSRHALHEHHELDELVEELQKEHASERGWIATAKKLSEKVHHHLKEEETKFFQLAGKVLTEAQKEKLAKEYEAEFFTLMTKKD